MRFSTGPVIVSVALVVAAGGATVARQSIPRGADVAKQLPPPDPSKRGHAVCQGGRLARRPGPRRPAASRSTLYAAKSGTRAGRTCCRTATCSSRIDRQGRRPNGSSSFATPITTARRKGPTPSSRGFGSRSGCFSRTSQLVCRRDQRAAAVSVHAGADEDQAAPGKVLDLPVGDFNYHWTRDVVANADGSKLFVSVGSGTNVDEEKSDVRNHAVRRCSK